MILPKVAAIIFMYATLTGYSPFILFSAVWLAFTIYIGGGRV